jgi:superfamily II DNA or RNA helicase
MSIIQEIKVFDIPVNVMIPLKNIKKKREPFDKIGVSVTQGCKPRSYHINLILHDHLKNCVNELPQFMSDSVMVFDEVHLFLNQSLRTSMGMNLSHLCKEFVSLTGTPLVDNKTEKLLGWLEQIVPFEVNKKNFWVAANSMLTKKVTTGIKTETKEVLAPFSREEEKRYARFVPPSLGGSNTNVSSRDWINAMDVCYSACDRKTIELISEMINNGRGVMLVTRNVEHQERMRDKIIAETKLDRDDIFLITSSQSIFLTDESVERKDVKDYKVVITTKNKSQGYTLTRLSVMITSVFPSNMATREQLKGRINRLGQKTQPILYFTTHIGILTNILENHNSAVSITKALQNLAKNV